MELPVELNISNLTKYYEGGDGDEVTEAQWIIPAASLTTKEIEEILGSHVGKSTRNKTYVEYLVKWKGRLVEDSSWTTREDVHHLGFLLNT